MLFTFSKLAKGWLIVLLAGIFSGDTLAQTTLRIQPAFSYSSNTLQLTLQGIDANRVYGIESSPAPGSIPFQRVVTGVPGQDSFTLKLEGSSPMFYRAVGTNQFGHPIPPGAFAAMARTPALGYNSWFANGVGISEKLIMAVTDAMATNGMKAVGYKYIVMDQGWSGSDRNPDGTPTISTNFPHGMAYLADYIHSRGLLMGLYTVTGPFYHGFIGSGGHLAQDAITYSKWGVDYVKIDGGDEDRVNFEIFGNAFLSTGRPLFYVPTSGNFQSWIPAETSAWRGSGGVNYLTDLVPGGVTDEHGVYYSGWEIFLEHIDYVAQYANTAGPGHWNDPDAADASVGPAWSPGRAKPEMAMFSVLACDLLWDYIPPSQYPALEPLFYMTNSEVIAVHQDAAGIQGTLVGANSSGFGQVWCRPLGATNGNAKAVCLLNRDTNQAQTITVPWSAIGFSNGPAQVRDLFQHANVGIYTSNYTTTIPPQNCQLVTITTGAPPFLHPGTNYISDQGYFANWTNGSVAMFGIPGMLWPGRDRSASKTPLSINGKVYSKGLGVLADSWLQFGLGGLASRFHAEIGVDDAFIRFSRVIFRVWLDDRLIYDGEILVNGSTIDTVDVDVTGGKVLTLQVVKDDLGVVSLNGSADWGDAYVICP